MVDALAKAADKYYIHDARSIDELLPDEEVIDVTITSPPYWNLKDYGSQKQIGFGQSYDNYLGDMESVFRKIFHRTRPTGCLWIISDTFKQNGELVLLPFDISERLKQIGWILQDIIIWQKDKALPWSHQGKLRNIFEYVALYSKSRRFKYRLSSVRDVNDVKTYWVRYPERYSPEGKTPSRNWVFPIPRQGSWGKNGNYVKHACPLPPGLVERMLCLTSDAGDVVLDPFAGSGSVLASACALDRRYIGLDLNPDYCSMFRSKVLPAVIKEHRTRTSKTNGDAITREKFGGLIRSLRMLKYPREIIRLYLRQRKTLACCAVLALRLKNPVRLLLVFIFPHRRGVPKQFLTRAHEICGRPPLSKYGLDVDVLALTTDRLSQRYLAKLGLKPSSRLKQYTEGRFYAWDCGTTVRTFFRSVKNRQARQSALPKYPPIFSNVSVHVNPKCPEEAFDDSR